MDLSLEVKNLKLIGMVAASLVAGAACYTQFFRKKPRWVQVGTVDKLYVHALKGGKAREIYSAEFGWLGLKAGVFTDRSFMIINDRHGAVYSMDVPKTVLIDLVFEDGKFFFKAPEMEVLEVDPEDLVMKDTNMIECTLLDTEIKCVGCGKKYDEWISRYICGESKGYKLAYFGQGAERPARPGFVAMWPETFKNTDLTTFNNTTAYNLVTWSSIKSLNGILGLETTPEWYRPSIVISNLNGEPYEEEKWRKRLKIGNDVILHFIKECQRCLVIAVDPITGTRNTANIEKLREFRLMDHGIAGTPDPVLQKRRMNAMGKSPFFSVNYGIDAIGHVNIGDPVYAEMDD